MESIFLTAFVSSLTSVMTFSIENYLESKIKKNEKNSVIINNITTFGITFMATFTTLFVLYKFLGIKR